MEDEKARAKKDIIKLMQILKEFKAMRLDSRYPEVLKWAENYLFDSKYFFNNKDYFSAFGSANYAFGIIDGILIINGKKKDETEP